MKVRLLNIVFMLLAGACYGFISPLMKLAYQAGFRVEDVTNAQYGFALVVLWALALVRFRRFRLPRRQWVLLLCIGIAGATVSYAYYLALTKLPASLGIVLLFQFAWMVMLMDIIVTRRWPGVEKWVGMVLIVIGTILSVGLVGQRVGHFPLWAFGLGLVAALGYGFVLYLSSYVTAEASPLVRSAVIVTVSTIVIALLFKPTYLWSGVLWQGLWKWGLLVALLGQVIPMLLILLSSPKIGGRMAGVLGSIELPVAVTSAHLLLAERVTWIRWTGVLLIVAGICLSELIDTSKRVQPLNEVQPETP